MTMNGVMPAILFRGETAGLDQLRATTNFSRRIKLFVVASLRARKIPLAASGKSPAHFRASRLDEEGATRSSRALGSGCDGRDDVAAGYEFADERHIADGEVVWSRHPGADAKSATL
jgi:hypothetical protein